MIIVEVVVSHGKSATDLRSKRIVYEFDDTYSVAKYDVAVTASPAFVPIKLEEFSDSAPIWVFVTNNELPAGKSIQYYGDGIVGETKIDPGQTSIDSNVLPWDGVGRGIYLAGIGGTSSATVIAIGKKS